MSDHVERLSVHQVAVVHLDVGDDGQSDEGHRDEGRLLINGGRR